MFPGVSGTYRVSVTVQTEFDESSPYKISINGRTVAPGHYPGSKGRLICDCPDWRKNCPNEHERLDAGPHQINTGDTIEAGATTYTRAARMAHTPCGTRWDSTPADGRHRGSAFPA